MPGTDLPDLTIKVCNADARPNDFVKEFIQESMAYDQTRVVVKAHHQVSSTFAKFDHLEETFAKLKLAERLTEVAKVQTAKEAADCVYSALQTTDVILLAIKERDAPVHRILEETAAEPATAPAAPKVSEPNDNVIYVKPDAIFGMALSVFVFFVAYVGVMCLYNTNTPLTTPKKAFKFGREM